MVSEKTILWRQKYASEIQVWQNKIRHLKDLYYQERWTLDKFEMEIVPLIQNQKMREVFTFSKNYIYKRKRGHFRDFMRRIYQEIIDFGVMEPSQLNHAYYAIQKVRSRLKW